MCATISCRVLASSWIGPIRSRHPSTNSSEVEMFWIVNLSIMYLMPGRSVLTIWSATKFILCRRVPVSIHSGPVCQPSTLGGLRRVCPWKDTSSPSSENPGLKSLKLPRNFIVLVTISTGLLTLENQQLSVLNKSELNNTLSVERILNSDSVSVLARTYIAWESRAGSLCQLGTGTSSATKKL